ncbi:MAG: cob(I)yrinic acid a,c-diamide adenosyltransferase [Selenomonadaceae bacterium]
MSVYTKTGDQGKTSLLSGQRVDKASLRVEAYGTVDEVNSSLAMARAFCENEDVKEKIIKLQQMNMMLMADLASVDSPPYITAEHVSWLESSLDQLEEQLPPINKFIVAGDTKGGAALDMARTTVRRAERRVLEFAKIGKVDENVRLVLNRQSDLCFMLMRLEETNKIH